MKTKYLSHEVKREKVNHYEVVEHNGKRFKIHIKTSSYEYQDYNDDCTLSIMTGEGTWKELTDNRSIGVNYERNDLTYGKTDEQEKIVAFLVENFKEYIMALY